MVDPAKPGRYLLGIECDGASYHSARSARDRDRLRQQVLEDLDWRIHRIWSTDWFLQRDREIKRLLGAIEEANASASPQPRVVEAPQTQLPVPITERESKEVAAHQPASGGALRVRASVAVPYKLARLDATSVGEELHLVAQGTLSSWIVTVVQTESPVHFSEVARRIAQSAGVGRVGTRIEAALRQACALAERSGQITRQGDFLWCQPHRPAEVRNRGELPAASRKLELIAPEEIEASIKMVVSASYGMARAEIPAAVCRLLGFARVSEDMRLQVQTRIAKLVDARRLVAQGDILLVAKKQ